MRRLQRSTGREQAHLAGRRRGAPRDRVRRWMERGVPGGTGTPSIAASDEGAGRVRPGRLQRDRPEPARHHLSRHDLAVRRHRTTRSRSPPSRSTPTPARSYDADMEINTYQTQIVTVTPGPDRGQYDFDSIITHEAGHFLGLAHTPLETAVMFALYTARARRPDERRHRRHLRDLLPRPAPAPTELDAGTAIVPVTVQEAAPCDPTPRHGFGSQCGPLGSPPATTSGVHDRGRTGERAGRWRVAPWSRSLGAVFGLGIARRRRAARVVAMKRLRGGGALLTARPRRRRRWAQLAAEREARGERRRSRSSSTSWCATRPAAAIVTPYEQKPVWEEGPDHHVHARARRSPRRRHRSRANRGSARWAEPSARSGRSWTASRCSRSASRGFSFCSRTRDGSGVVRGDRARAGAVPRRHSDAQSGPTSSRFVGRRWRSSPPPSSARRADGAAPREGGARRRSAARDRRAPHCARSRTACGTSRPRGSASMDRSSERDRKSLDLAGRLARRSPRRCAAPRRAPSVGRRPSASRPTTTPPRAVSTRGTSSGGETPASATASSRTPAAR